jgi:CSLREA domain-containing protein
MIRHLVSMSALLTLLASAQADVISVNFVGGQSGSTAADVTKGGANVTGTAGAVPANNWNNEGPSQQAAPISIVNAAGAPAASLAYTAPANWAATATSPVGGTNAALMSGYLDNLQNSGTITVTGLGAAFTSGGYQVLVYQNTDSNGSFGYTATDNAGHTVTAYGLQTGGAGGNYPLAGGTNGFVGSTSTNPTGPASAANYVILNGLTGSNFTIQAAVGTTGDGRVRPNGFQIVSPNSGAITLTVTIGEDHDDGVCNAADCTLREAVNVANTITGTSSVIQFAGNVSLVTLTAGQLTITKHTVVEGGGTVTISGSNSSPAFQLNSGASLTLNNLTITKCFNPSSDGGAVRNGSSAGNGGTLFITNCKFLQNTTMTGSSGGAIVSYGPLTITNSEFGSNQAGNGGAIFPRFSQTVTTITGCNFHDNSTLNTTNGWGGAMLLWDGAPVTVTNSQFTNNMAKSGSFSSSTIDRGGAIYVTFNSSLTVDNCQLASNSAFFGGALYVDPGGTATVTNSDLHDNSIGIFDGTQGGGAIYNAGTLTVDTDQLHDNHADGGGGAINNIGSLTVRNSTLRHNTADSGGGIANQSNATVDRTTIADNSATNYGGAIDDSDETDTSKQMTVTASTLSGNSAGFDGGAIESEMKLTLTNVTISGNTGPEILNHFSRLLTLTNVTLAQNTGIGMSLHNSATVAMRNTLLASNSGGNCSGAIPSNGFNLADDTTCSLANTGDHQGASFNPLLGPLQNNGGPTLTLLPGSGSPAIDGGTGSGAPATDQRGVGRPKGAADDIGAVEVQPSDFPSPTPTPTATPAGVVANVSTRLPVGINDNVLIEGLIVQGPAGSTKKLIVRAIGPSLVSFGIPDALTNPTLEIHDTNALIAMNNDWRTTQTGGIIAGDQSAEIGASGVAPGNDLESAIIANLSPGSYTAVVQGAGGGTGTGVVDAYDLNAASAARVANISTRGLIQPGDKLMIAGFIIQNGPVRVVVSAIGPSLQAFGITNALPDTTLQLKDQNGVTVRENDDWMTDQKAELEATGLQPANNLEAALVQTIPPGQYTAQVRGKPETTGIGVVQVFFLQN